MFRYLRVTILVRHRRRTCLRRSARTDRRGAADGVAQDHHPDDEAAHPQGGARRRAGPDHHGRWRQQLGRGPRTQAAAGSGLALQAAPGQWPGPSPGTNSPQDCLCLGSAYRIAFGPRANQKVLTLQGAMPRDADFKQTLCADIQGFSLHAAVRCGADDRQGLEQLCRYIMRPPCRPRPVSGRAPRQAQTVHRTVCVRARLWPTSACKPTPPGKWCSSSRPPGATAPSTWC